MTAFAEKCILIIMLDKAKDILNTHAANKRIAVAVSGGRDSMCLLHLLTSLDFIDKKNILVLNVEHGIRGESSIADSDFVRRYCEENGLDLIVERADVPSRCAESGRGEEEEARLVRREFFFRILEAGKAELVLIAHHSDDNAESVLMHILRGCGLSGLRGMDVLSGEILRPLLSTSRAEIDEYVEKNAVPYVEDETNANNEYFRNFVRNRVFPLLNEHADANGSLLRLMEAARRDDDFIRSLIDESSAESAPLGGVRVKSVELLKNPALSSRTAMLMLKRLTGDYTSDGVDAIVKCASLSSGGKLEIAGGLVVANEYDYVTLCRKREPFKGRYGFGEGDFDFGGFTAHARICDAKEAKVGKNADGALYIAAEKVGKSAELSTRKDGEKFEPFGGGTRKLKEFFIDKKIPSRLRDFLPILRSGGKILAVFGVEISQLSKLDNNSEKAYKLWLTDEKGEIWKG